MCFLFNFISVFNFVLVCFVQTGDEDYDVVPDSKFVVSRTAFSDNSSYYRVDNKKCTYKDVAKLLRGSGIDLDHNRFLILQVSFGMSVLGIDPVPVQDRRQALRTCRSFPQSTLQEGLAFSSMPILIFFKLDHH